MENKEVINEEIDKAGAEIVNESPKVGNGLSSFTEY